VTEYVEALRALRDEGVRALVVGVFGIKFHTAQRGPVLFTDDCDLLLPAEVDQLTRAVRTLRALGCEISAGGEPLPDEDPVVLAGIVRNRACARAASDRVSFDLPLEIAGGSFEELWSRRRSFRLGELEVAVAALPDLLRSKTLANRPKDRLFLETYRTALEAIADEPDRG
jgi:hypothetical protein